MQLTKSETNYYFAIPLQAISIEKYGLKLEEQYGFCSLHYPSKFQDPDDFIYFVKAYDIFSKNVIRDFQLIKNQSLLFGESRFIPYIPVRGEMKWIQIHEEAENRDLHSFPNYKTCNLLTDRPPNQRVWYFMKHGGLDYDEFEVKTDYEKVKHLESGQETGEVGVKYRIYIELIKRELRSVHGELSLNEWKDVIFNLIRNEPATKKMSSEDLKSGMIENYIYDWVDIWSWDKIPDFPKKKLSITQKTMLQIKKHTFNFCNKILIGLVSTKIIIQF